MSEPNHQILLMKFIESWDNMNEKEIIEALMNKSSRFESSEDIDVAIEEIYQLIINTASNIKNRLVSMYKYTNNETKALMDLDDVYEHVESKMDEFVNEFYSDIEEE